MIRITLENRDHECAAGERPCECKLYALVTEAGDVERLNVLMASPEYVRLVAQAAGEEHRAVERAARAARQREGLFKLVDEYMREDLRLGHWGL